MATLSNAQRIENLKAKLKAGNLSQTQINDIASRIKFLGGKVNVANFPTATSGTKTQTPGATNVASSGATSGKAATGGNDAAIAGLKEKLKTGGLTQAQIQNISERIQFLGGKVNLTNFPPATDVQGPPVDDTGGGSQKPTDPPAEDTPPPPPAVDGDLNAGMPTDSGYFDPNNIGKLKDVLGYGEQLGNNIIDKFGLEGEFLGRIDEGPSQIAVDDLQRIRELAIASGNMTPLEQEAIDVNRNALQGLSSQENQALVEAARQEMMREFAGRRSELQR
jgi:ribosomal protein S13